MQDDAVNVIACGSRNRTGSASPYSSDSEGASSIEPGIMVGLGHAEVWIQLQHRIEGKFSNDYCGDILPVPIITGVYRPVAGTLARGWFV
jgi:hypothetical protein